MNALETARGALQAQLEPIASEAAGLKAKLDTLDRTKAQLEAALKALSSNKKGKTKAASKTAKPYARKSDVLAVCLAIVQANPKISKAELEPLAKHKLANDLGFSLSGVGLRLRECLESDSFVLTADGSVSIAPALPNKASGKAQHAPNLSVESLPVNRKSP